MTAVADRIDALVDGSATDTRGKLTDLLTSGAIIRRMDKLADALRQVPDGLTITRSTLDACADTLILSSDADAWLEANGTDVDALDDVALTWTDLDGTAQEFEREARSLKRQGWNTSDANALAAGNVGLQGDMDRFADALRRLTTAIRQHA